MGVLVLLGILDRRQQRVKQSVGMNSIKVLLFLVTFIIGGFVTCRPSGKSHFDDLDFTRFNIKHNINLNDFEEVDDNFDFESFKDSAEYLKVQIAITKELASTFSRRVSRSEEYLKTSEDEKRREKMMRWFMDRLRFSKQKNYFP